MGSRYNQEQELFLLLQISLTIIRKGKTFLQIIELWTNIDLIFAVLRRTYLPEYGYHCIMFFRFFKCDKIREEIGIVPE